VNTNPTGDVVDLLLDQHALIKAGLAEVADSDGATRARAFRRLQDLLAVHEHGEQTVVHPAVRNEGKDSQAAADSIAQEQGADRAMAELRTLGTDDPAFDEAFDRFRQAVLAHAEHEETDEFPQLRKAFTAEQLRYLASELRTVQEFPLSVPPPPEPAGRTDASINSDAAG
jgi:hemerythrin superfamily protein